MNYCITLILFFAISASAANLLPNGSFEVGGRTKWGWQSSHNISYTPDYAVVNTSPFHGNNCFRMFVNNTNIARIYTYPRQFQPSTQYTISAMNRHGSAGSYTGLVGVRVIKTGDETDSQLTTNATTWHRISHTFTTSADPTECKLSFFTGSVSGGSGIEWFVDAVQLESGSSATAFEPENDLEVGWGVNPNIEGNAFLTGETVAIPLRFFNDSGASITNTVYIDVLDHMLSNRVSMTWKSFVFPTGLTTTNLDLTPPTSPLGHFRGIVRLPGRLLGTDEILFAILPMTNTLSHATNSILGAHIKANPYYLRLGKRMGIYKVRSLSGIGVISGINPFQWKTVEPTDNNFVYDDATVDAIHNEGMVVIASVGSSVSDVPAFALSGGFPVMSLYRDYLTNLVNHYSAKGVYFYEIWNEPEEEGGFNNRPDLTGAVGTNAMFVIKALQPESIVMGPTVAGWEWNGATEGYYASNALTLWWSGPMFDILTQHTYPGNDRAENDRSYRFVTEVADAIGFTGPLWNTEGGYITSSGYQHIPMEGQLGIDDYVILGDADGRDGISRGSFVGAMFGRMRRAAETFFIYDGRSKGAPYNPLSYAPWELDGTLRPSASVIAAANHFIQQRTSVNSHRVEYGPTAPDSTHQEQSVEVFVFEAGTNSIGFVNVNNKTNHYTATVSASGAVLYDIMGNPVGVTTREVSLANPLWIKGVGVSTNNLLSGITITTNASDVIPPVVKVEIAPLAATTNAFLFRVFARDRSGLQTPGITLGHTIQFRYSMVESGAPSYGAWQNTNYIYYASLPSSGTFSVQARDPHGNIATDTWTWPLAEPASETGRRHTRGNPLRIGR